jgi:Patatin-like phospholipase
MISKTPERNCDVVMKGGITSGVVYPLAMVELSEEFRFRNIGGTSAGAIAAAVTAAAEYCRQSEKGSTAGFERLKDLPNFLAGDTGGEPNLLNLFPPTKETRRLFSVAMAFVGDASAGEKGMNVLAALLTLSPLITIVSFLPALLLPVTLYLMQAHIELPVLAGLGLVELVLVLTGVILLVLGNAAKALFVTLPRNNFGFSKGRAPADCKLPGVSDWLTDQIQAFAGRPSGAPLLTFGDLWLAGETITDRRKQLEACQEDSDLRSINLQMISTALTHGQPYRLPFETRIFAFRESEMLEYFPKEVVDHLVANARPSEEIEAVADPDLHALPEPWNLPLVVAVRMSLSFPILFSMVPLYAVDRSLKANKPKETVKKFERCWFIDGGLSSNFPVSLFDSPFPRCPTFGIDLNDFHPDYPKDKTNEENNVWMIKSAGNGTSDQWTRFPDEGAGAIGGYVGAMLDTIRNWHDNTQLAVPGFRDRIVHVKLSPDEGGLNLNMNAKKVTSLSERGRWAAKLLRQRFGAAAATTDPLNWNSHRWTRYRTSMALLQKAFRQMDRAFSHTDKTFPDYNTLLARASDAGPKTGYWWPRDPAEFRALTTEFLKLAARLQNPPGGNFDEDAPNPRPELRVTPRL